MMEKKDDFTEWDIKLAEWKGYTKEALQGLNDKISDLRESIILVNKKLDKIDGKIERTYQTLNNEIIDIRVKVAAIGGLSGLIIAFIVTVLLNGV